MNSTWIQTVSGKRVDLPIPKPEQIDIYDISWSLSMKCRFNGQCQSFYSVAEHSVRVSELCRPDLELAGLLHDANEAYLPDIPRPVKELIPEYKEIENLMEEAINKKYGITLTPEDKVAVKKADNIILATEGRDLMGNTEGWGLTETPSIYKVMCWTPEYARARFLERFGQLNRRRYGK